jgi:hypothetical protein
MPDHFTRHIGSKNVPAPAQHDPDLPDARDSHDRISSVYTDGTEGVARDARAGRDAAGRFSADNPGRPRGARNRATLFAEALRPDEAEKILRGMVEAALAGDAQARKVCFERLAPRRREAPLAFELPDIATPADAIAAGNAIPALIADGVLAPSEGAVLHHVVEQRRIILRSEELQAQCAADDARFAEKRQPMVAELFGKDGCGEDER